ncbi:mitochondrial import inner membrane translocase subunit Tim29 [Stegostoma tigrinum]|uniref:mitochondrial import inner membrane translocase subunit Tim29 n=1 Tax=Stegostoma tigrinum TaxID=3053191 RepID=UPI00202B7317|nr:mitochondrial import inner membrane translocase subunit Tim29 [Stegostoma tigrinum]
MATLWRRFCSLPPATALGFWSRVRNSNIGIWTWSLLNDYKEACKEIVVGARDHPGKAAFYCALLTGACVCGYKNPCDKSFQATLLESSNQLLVLSPWVRNSRSDQHIQNLVTVKNQGRLRHQNLLLFSLVYAAPYDAKTSLYNAQCEYLKPRWSDFPGRVLDIGFFGKWWILSSKMKDWDINDNEFAYLPDELQTVTPQNLHSTENERLFELKFQPVILEEEDTEEREAG